MRSVARVSFTQELPGKDYTEGYYHGDNIKYEENSVHKRCNHTPFHNRSPFVVFLEETAIVVMCVVWRGRLARWRRHGIHFASVVHHYTLKTE